MTSTDLNCHRDATSSQGALPTVWPLQLLDTFCSYNNTSSRLVQPHQQTEALMSSVRSLQLLQNRQFQSIFLKPWTSLAVLPFLPNSWDSAAVRLEWFSCCNQHPTSLSFPTGSPGGRKTVVNRKASAQPKPPAALLKLTSSKVKHVA